jgi:predicted phage-related endonuclease
MAIEQIKIDSKDQWLTLRKFDLTASVLGAVDGHDPYISPLRLYIEKRGIELPKQKDSPVLRRGRLFEAGVAAAVQDMRPEWRLQKCEFYYRDNDLGLGATPDYFIHADPRGLGNLQCKTVSIGVFDREWTEDTPPVRTIIQVRAETMLMNAKFGAVAVMVMQEPSYPCYLMEVPRDPIEEEKIRATVKKFWHDIEAGKQPEADYSLDRALIAALSPQEIGEKIIDLSQDNAVVSGLLERAELRAKIKADTERCNEIETMLMDKMQDAAVAQVPGFSVTWKVQHRKGYTVAPSDPRVLLIREKSPT